MIKPDAFHAVAPLAWVVILVERMSASGDVLLPVLGATGGGLYGYLQYLIAKQKLDSPSPRAMLALSIFAGAIFAGVCTTWIGAKQHWMVDPNPYPLALVIGVVANPVMPLFVTIATAFINKFGAK